MTDRPDLLGVEIDGLLVTDEALLAAMIRRGLTSPPANIVHIQNETLRAECHRRGFLPMMLDDVAVRAEATRRGMFEGERERMSRVVRELTAELHANHERELRGWFKANAELAAERNEWERRYRALESRQMGPGDALRAVWGAALRAMRSMLRRSPPQGGKRRA